MSHSQREAEREKENTSPLNFIASFLLFSHSTSLILFAAGFAPHFVHFRFASFRCSQLTSPMVAFFAIFLCARAGKNDFSVNSLHECSARIFCFFFLFYFFCAVEFSQEIPYVRKHTRIISVYWTRRRIVLILPPLSCMTCVVAAAKDLLVLADAPPLGAPLARTKHQMQTNTKNIYFNRNSISNSADWRSTIFKCKRFSQWPS